MLMALPLCFTACSSDNDDNDSNENKGKKYLAEITVKEHQWKFGERSEYGDLYERFTYNEENLLIKLETNYYLSAVQSRIPKYTLYAYDERNRLVEKNEYELSLLQNKYRYQYNEFDSVSVMQKYSKDGSLNETHTYEYDTNHRLIKDTEIVNYVRNDYGYIHTYTYSGNKVTEVITMFEDGSPFGTYVREYDSHKNLISSSYTSAQDGKTSISKYEYEYDSKGRISKSTSPYSILYKRYKEYTYNDDGTINKIHLSYSDRNDQSDLIYTYTWK